MDTLRLLAAHHGRTPSWTHSHPLLSPIARLVIGSYPRLSYSPCLDADGPRSPFPRSPFSHASTELTLFLLRTPVWVIREVTETSTSLAYHTPSCPSTYSIACLGAKKRTESKFSLFSLFPRPQWCRKRALTTPIDVRRDDALGRAGQDTEVSYYCDP